MHHDISGKLSDYFDDELTLDERRTVEAHLQACDECSATLASMRRIVHAAAALRDEEPPRDLWPGIANRIGVESRPGSSRRFRRFAFTIPQLAAAGLALAVLSGWLAIRALSPGDRTPAIAGNTATPASAPASGDASAALITFNDEQYDAAIRDLQQALEHGRSRLDPDTIAAVQQDLRVIDAAVDDARRALAADPSNRYLSGYVMQTQQRKLDVLRRVTALARPDSM
jgi:Putative zinc-finger